jgi:hypothetical protein
MAQYSGYEGTVKIGSTAVGEVRNWRYTEDAELQDASTIGGGQWRKNRATMKGLEGEIECFYDPDNALQNQMSAGASVTLILVSAEGKQKTIPAVIASVDVDMGGTSGLQQRNFTWRSNGAPS